MAVTGLIGPGGRSERLNTEKEGTDREMGMSLDWFNFGSQFNTTPWKILKHTKSSSTVFVGSSSGVPGLLMLCVVTGDGTRVSFVPGICSSF